MLPFMKYSMSVHHTIIYTGLKDLTPMPPLNRDKGIFCLQRMNGIQEKQLARRQWNWLFDTVATNIIYNKITIDNAI